MESALSLRSASTPSPAVANGSPAARPRNEQELLRGLKGHDLAAPGLPDEPAQLAACVAAGGRAPGALGGCALAFNLVRLAAIPQGILARSLQGPAEAADARAAGEQARRRSDTAWRRVQSIG